ncbi:MAG: hypothetical protein LBM93_14975, partial [Oscillospiraceae bacterium]|nr:hypothetical protein [Oscillospiraceae bacterium]
PNDKNILHNILSFGSQKAKGKYIVFANEYTIWSKNFIKESVDSLEKENADLSYSDLAIKWANGANVNYPQATDFSKSNIKVFVDDACRLTALRLFDNKLILKDLWEKAVKKIPKNIGIKDFFNSELLLSVLLWSESKKFVYIPNEFSAIVWTEQDKFISKIFKNSLEREVVEEFKSLYNFLTNDLLLDIDVFFNNYINYYYRTSWVANGDFQTLLQKSFNIQKFTEFNYPAAVNNTEYAVEDIGKLIELPFKLNLDAESDNNISENLFKVQNIIFPEEEALWRNHWMYYRGDWLNDGMFLPDKYDFLTYFNSLSIKKWRKYTNVSELYLVLNISGDFDINLVYKKLSPEIANNNFKTIDAQLEFACKNEKNDMANRSICYNIINKAKTETLLGEVKSYSNSILSTVVLPISLNDDFIVGFELNVKTNVKIHSGGYYVKADENLLNNVDIAICTTTFKQEKFILHNLNEISKNIFNSEETGGLEDLGKHLFINVVDNGQTLPNTEIHENIKIFPNPNVGGAGGFSRGMIEALNEKNSGEFDATHIIFMDDDVKILPESLKRTYALLKLLKKEYSDSFISGAMLDLDLLNLQYEDLGFVSTQLNAYAPVKQRLEMHLIESVLKNDIDIPLKNRYAAWWYCCVPIKYVAEDKLSVPIFYRGDDIEFSRRNNPDFITLGGICIWHKGFEKKLSAPLEYYLVNRNSMVTQAISGIFPDCDVLERIEQLFREEIRKFNYIACDFLLDALEDYLKGPEYYMQLNGINRIKEQNTKKEKMYSYAYIGFPIDETEVYDFISLQKDEMELFIETDNGHTLEDFELFDHEVPNVIAHLFFESPQKQYLQKRLIAVDIPNKQACIRLMDKNKYKGIIERHDNLFERYKKENSSLVKKYRKLSKELHSKDFWMSYFDKLNNEKLNEEN